MPGITTHTIDYTKQRIHGDTIHPFLKSVRTSRNRRTSHPSNPFPSPEQCDNLCDSVRLIYATWSVFFSAKIEYTVTNTHSHPRATPVPGNRQALRDTNQFILQIIRRHPQICGELDRTSTRFIIWRKHRDKYEDVAVHCCSVSATTSPWLAAPPPAWAAAPRPAWLAVPGLRWAVEPPDILQSTRTGDAHVSIY